ncbi:DNA/RNA helicase domain-containing protein [Priestia sp. JSM ZJ58]|uniref:DNA/RNA helicase domain-containing protein n=1 Tax=Priestia sp. JSM ZJ58 TaxID=3376189 RepID=UPI0037A1224B
MKKFYGWAGTISEFINIEEKQGANPKNKKFHELMTDFINGVKKDLNLENFEVQQGNIESWKSTYKLFKNTLKKVISLNPSLEDTAWVVAEYVIPGSSGLRTDFILILPNNHIYVIEFKGSNITDGEMSRFTDYINDIKHFHSYSKNSVILPWLLFWTTTNTSKVDSSMLDISIEARKEGIYKDLAIDIVEKSELTKTNVIEPRKWVEGHFQPHPGILIEGIDLLVNRRIPDLYINRSDNVINCIELIKKACDYCEQRKKHALIVVKGVPGAGKTMVGFGTLGESRDIGNSIYITGNGPLDVLLRLKVVDAVIEDRKKRRIEEKTLVSQELVTNIFEYVIKLVELHNINPHDINVQLLKDLIFKGIYNQNQVAVDPIPIYTIELVKELLVRLVNELGIPHAILNSFTLDHINSMLIEHDRRIAEDFARSTIMGMRAFESSNVTFPIVIFDEAQRVWEHQIENLFKKIADQEWGVLIALIGEGQIINKKEVGTIDKWLENAVAQKGSWLFLLPNNISHNFNHDRRFFSRKELLLDVSIRSLYWSEWHRWIDCIFKSENSKAKSLIYQLGSFEIAITGSREIAERFAKDYFYAEDNHSYGWIGSSTGFRGRKTDGLFPLFVRTADSEKVYGPWFSGKSNELKIMISEFACQGLELDLVLLRWGNDLIVNEEDCLVVSENILNDEKKYIFDKYRVLLTRARKKLVIWCENDKTRDFLIKCGAKDLDIYYKEDLT